MPFYQIILIFLGLSLDVFVVMMNKGATVRGLSLKNSIVYALIFSCVAMVAFLAGYGLSNIFRDNMSSTVQISAACLIIFAIGLFLAVHSYARKEVEEKLDPDFNYRNCLKLAFYANIDTFFLAVGLFFLGISLWSGVLLAFLMTFATVLVALRIGYVYGSAHTRIVGMSGGLLMVFFAIYLLSVFVLAK